MSDDLKAAIRQGQLANVEALEAELRRNRSGRILLEGRLISREAAWAATAALRAAWARDLPYDGQEIDDHGVWWARMETPSGPVKARLGLFSESEFA